MKTAIAKSSKLLPQVRPTAALQMYLDTISYKTRERLELINITKDLNEVVKKNGLKAGFLLVQSLHTTTAIFINEFQQALLDDIKRFLERLVGRFDYWRHNDPRISECSRQNADSHLRAMLLGHTLSVPVRRNRAGWVAVGDTGRAGWAARAVDSGAGARGIRATGAGGRVRGIILQATI
jgi:secondary thiamine-phosphate synthase enzyme